MSLFGAQDRDPMRRRFAEAWRKHRERIPLTPLEALIADVIAMHPEYHRWLADPDTAAAYQPPAAAGTNPFLHLGLHIAVREQLAVDRPPGIRALHQQLLGSHPLPHAAEHVLVEALGETLWEAQRAGRAPDEARYLELAGRGLPGGHGRT